MTRPAVLVFALLLAGCATIAKNHVPTESALHPLIGDEIGLDHVLLWSKNSLDAEASLAEAGFKLSDKAGSYGAGISNRLIWFRNWSFIEFLWLSEPAQTLREAPAEYAFATTHNGSNAFGLSVADADETYRVLTAAGLSPDQPGAEAYDPDGPEGPKEPVENQWRFMFLKDQGLPGNPFFVEYKSDASEPRAEQHPNGAQRLSSVWILVNDVEAAAKAYEGAKFSVRKPVSLPTLGLEGVCLPAGEGEVLLLTPIDDGPFSMVLRARGEHVVGLSVQVVDLASAAKSLSTRYHGSLVRYSGRFGDSLLLPSLEPLGLAIEFHQ